MLPKVPKSDFPSYRQFPPRMFMQFGEIDILLALIDSVKPKTMIEIGVNTGMTAQVMLNHVDSIKTYIGIDVLPGYRTAIPEQQSEVPMSPGYLVNDDSRFELLLRPHGSLNLKPNDLPQAEAIFIDGDHSYGAVMNDSGLAFSRIQPGGIIVWHDYGNQSVEVTMALEDLHTIDHRNIFRIEGTWLAFERY